MGCSHLFLVGSMSEYDADECMESLAWVRIILRQNCVFRVFFSCEYRRAKMTCDFGTMYESLL